LTGLRRNLLRLRGASGAFSPEKRLHHREITRSFGADCVTGPPGAKASELRPFRAPRTVGPGGCADLPRATPLRHFVAPGVWTQKLKLIPEGDMGATSLRLR
jgi:hypothetical protein